MVIDISDNNHWEWLVMKESLVEFDNPKKFFTLGDLVELFK